MTVTLDISTEQATQMAQLFGLPVATQEDIMSIAQAFIDKSCAEARRRQEEALRQRLMAGLQAADIDILDKVQAILLTNPAATA